jgi:hypothetical protein
VAIERKMEVSSLATRRPPLGFKASCRAGDAPSKAEDGGTDPLRPGRSPGFEPGTASMAVSSSTFGSPARCERAGDGRGRRNRIPRRYPPPGFRPGPAAWLVHPPRAEGDRLERYGVTRASASNGARRLAGSPSILPLGRNMRAARYAQTGTVVNPPPQGVPYPRFELGASVS